MLYLHKVGPSSASIKFTHETERHLQFWDTKQNAWSDVITEYVEYVYNGVHYPAYCANVEKQGVKDGIEYDVNLIEHINDNRIWRVIKNGYPYQTPATIGVANEDDAFVATKHAIYSVLYNRDVMTYYHYRDGDTRGANIVNAINKLANIGKTGTETPSTPVLNANKIGSFKQDTNKTDYFSQEYSVSAGVNINKYSVSISNIPSGAFVSDLSGNPKSNFSSGEHFKILVPKNSISENKNINISLNGECLTYPMFYGHSPDSNTYQDYYLTFSEFGDVSGTSNLNINSNQSTLKIVKSDKDTDKPLSSVTFNIKYSDGTQIGNFTTDAQGIIQIPNLKPGKVIITETSTQSEYILDSIPKEATLNYSELTQVKLTNEHKKGNLKIIKVDKDDHSITLDGVEFELRDLEGNLVKKLVTNSYGIAEAKGLNTGKYILKEVSTKKEYQLTIDQNVTIEWDKTIELTVENEKRKGQIKVVKVDSENNEIKLEGVEFQIIDKDGNVVETIKTNRNGEAVTSKLPIGDYKIKETNLGTNQEYILDDEEKTITIEENKINTITIQNKLKKGNLKIFKVDLDDETIPVSGVEFEITDSRGNIYHATSDENGNVFIENIPIGNVTIKELKTKDIYELSSETYSTEIKWNETSSITIKNEKLKGQIEVYKTDSENKEIKIKGVEFQVLNSNEEVVETIVTDENGYAITSRLPIGEYYLKEVKTDEKYVLSYDVITSVVEANKVTTLEIENDKIKGQIKIIKTSKTDNELNGQKAGSPIADVEFEIYDLDGNLVDKIVTDENGIAISKELEYGIYKIREVKTNEFYLLNSEEFEASITKDGDIVELNIQNEPKPVKKLPKTGF